MATLQDFLAEEGFEQRKLAKAQRKVKFKDDSKITSVQNESVALPIYICYDRKSLDFSKGKSRKSESSERRSIKRSSAAEGSVVRGGEPAIDLVAIRAVISILSGYIGQYLSDKGFRAAIREKCCSCFERGNGDDQENGVLANMELGIESVERLVESEGSKKELKVKSLQNSIRLLTIVASLNSESMKNGSTCGTPNSHLSACAQLYLAIVYKVERNDRISARHLLQVFCDSPFLARTHLLPELWEHLFLPHLLHISVWYSEQLGYLVNLNQCEKQKKMTALDEIYNNHVDFGTKQFAGYYKDWLKVGAQAPAVPSVPLPSKTYAPSRRKSSDSMASQSSIKSKSLYQSVFGPIRRRQSLDLDYLKEAVVDKWSLREEDKFCTTDRNSKMAFLFQEKSTKVHRRSSSQSYARSKNEFWPSTQRTGYFRFMSCKNEGIKPSVPGNHLAWNDSVKKTEDVPYSVSTNLHKACRAICFSGDLRECEMAIKAMAKACIDSAPDAAIECTLSQEPVIEGILEVLYASEDDEILELGISILAELVKRNDKNATAILNSDPQQHIFMRLLGRTGIFLKAAVLLYLVKPTMKQMISMEWIPLVLRVLEFGDQVQTLFTVQCSPQEAAYYLLSQVLTGNDEGKILEHARLLISLGGLRLLVRRMEKGDYLEKDKAASIIYHCLQADGSCRHYLAKSLNNSSILSLLTLRKDENSKGHAFALLAELLCLRSISQRTELLKGLVSAKGSLNAIHILLAYLHRAQPEERPLIAAFLLQLDLLGDPLEFSICREEAIEALIEALDCRVLTEKVQEQSAKALLVLGGHFSHRGDPQTEDWLLRKAGFETNPNNPLHEKQTRDDGHMNQANGQKMEADEIENWQRKSALVLYNRGSKKFLSALSDSIEHGIPPLARASLVTIAWMSSYFHVIIEKNLQSVACSIIVPRLVEGLRNGKALEERILATFALFNLMKCSGYASKHSPLDKELVSHLRKLSQVTWTAKELLSIIRRSSRKLIPMSGATPA